MTIGATKAELRASCRAARRALKAADPLAADKAAAFAPPGLLASRGPVALYTSVGSELDTRPLHVRLNTAGVAVALPVVTAEGTQMIFRLCTEDPLEPDALGLLAPPASAPQVRPAVVVVPLLAFDLRGGRLGQGGGYYDRTLAALRASAPLLAIGLAYAGQQVERTPMEAHDQRLDGVLTETAYLDFT